MGWHWFEFWTGAVVACVAIAAVVGVSSAIVLHRLSGRR